MDETKMESAVTALADSMTEDADANAQQESDVTADQLMQEQAPQEEQA